MAPWGWGSAWAKGVEVTVPGAVQSAEKEGQAPGSDGRVFGSGVLPHWHIPVVPRILQEGRGTLGIPSPLS